MTSRVSSDQERLWFHDCLLVDWRMEGANGRNYIITCVKLPLSSLVAAAERTICRKLSEPFASNRECESVDVLCFSLI